MAFRDIREFIQKLKETADLIEVKEEVDWNLEVGAITRRTNELESPAPLFLKIKDYPPSYRIFGSPLATFRRLAIALDLDPSTPYEGFLDAYEQGIKNPIKPILVKDGPCKENICTGDKIDLWQFPSPVIHEGDGGRYIGTWHISATKDPDSAWINWGMYRLMVHDKKTLGGLMIPTQHIGMILNKYESRHKPMEIAIAIAPEPMSTFVATSAVPAGINEVDIIGGFRKQPLEVVKAETVDLMVPAAAEIVIEGIVPPGVRKDEGPFGEYTGYSTGGRGPRPIVEVTAITYRNNPILTMSNMGVPMDESDVAMNISWAAGVRSDLLSHGFPITGVYIPPESAETMIVIATKTPYANIVNQIAGCVWANKNGVYLPRVIVVSDDIDPTNMKEVIFALGTKCHPYRSTQVIKDMPGSPLIPFLTEAEKQYFKCSNVVYDCTWPLDWDRDKVPKLASFREIYPKEIQQKVLSKWETYGFNSSRGD